MKRKQRSEMAKHNIWMVFQSYHLLDDLTVGENIDLPLSYKVFLAASGRRWWRTRSTVFRSPQKLSDESGAPVSELVRRAIDEYPAKRGRCK
jgi:ABC-type lipoprotein export system ATPase subunit